MRCFLAALGAIGALLAAPAARPLAAQTRTPAWNAPYTRQVVELATARRAQQLADTGLVDYQALAHGYLTFLAQVGEGFTEPPRIVKADELALEVYWKAPNLSKQRIVGRRDTLLLPTDINYHRDHLGIVQNNFPEIIRLGDGDEVRDVPHPLSARGLQEYDFAIVDSLRIVIPGRAIDVYQVRVRPRNDREARIVGALFIDREGGQVVRMAFSFTRSAFLDRNLEDLSIVLENRLVNARWWLPSRQEIEIRRTGRFLDYPARGIIRGRWEIGDYQVNRGFAAPQFAGPEIVQAPASERSTYQWQGRILDSLPPDVRVTTDEDVRRVQEEARALVRAEALQRGRSAALAGRSVSDFARFNRVEGLALGAGYRQRLGGGVSTTLRGRFGLEDREPKGEITLGWQNASGQGVRLHAYRDHREAGDEQERSGVANSLAAQEFGSDHTDPYEARGGALRLDLVPAVQLELGVRTDRPLEVSASPASGRFRPTLAATDLTRWYAAVRLEQPTRLRWFGTEVSASADFRLLNDPANCAAHELGDSRCRFGSVRRASATLHVERPFGTQRLVARSLLAAVGGSEQIPVQDLAFFGGPTSGPGYDFHSIVATAGFAQRLEWRAPVPFVRVPLGRFGRSPARATLAPFAHLVVARPVAAPVRGDSAVRAIEQWGAGWRGHPAVGVGLLTVFDILRFDVARGLRDGRWTFSVDVTRDFWRVL